MSAHTDSDNPRPLKRARASFSHDDASSLQCQVCHRTYERIDHLNRHLDSHRNERSFRCDECPAAFNRRDLLLRHQATHAKNAAVGQVGPNRSLQRATKACDACVVSKVKCNNDRPCRRCVKKSIECTTRISRSGTDSFVPYNDEQPDPVFTPPPDLPAEPVVTHEGPPGELAGPQNVFIEANSGTQDIFTTYDSTVHEPHALSSFFEQIMVTEPDFLGTEYLQPPPDLTTWLPELDWFGQVDIFGNDFAPAIDETFQTPQTDASCAATTTPRGTVINPGREINSDDAVRRRHAVFRQSPWMWFPKRNQNAFSENEDMTFDERQVDLASSPHQPHASGVIIPGRLSQQARDRIYHLVLKTAHSQVTVPSFPSADCLDKLIKVGIAKRTETDAWIHPYTFDSETSIPEFLAALVAAGCICFGIPSVNKTGLVLHEIVRVSLRELAEGDNSTTRELQYLQASMLWLDIGAFCGFRRKMEIAESSLQVLVTSLRRAGRFDYVRYPNVVPHAEDSDGALDKKWREWIEIESYKRLVYHLLEHDIYMTMINHRQPLLSYAEVTVPLPASKMLWLAPSATAWRQRFMSMAADDTRPSLRSILQEEGSILCLSEKIDSQIARSSYLHGLAAQIWEHSQQIVLLQDFSDPSSQLWSRSRQQKLQQCLQYANFTLENSSPLTCIFHQFLQMFLHVDLDTVTRFAGRCGEEAAHRAYIALQSWSKTKEARTAIGHAGQVIHGARAIPPYQNRGQDSFIIYHAIMVLWTYSMMISDHARKTGSNTPVLEEQGTPSQNTRRAPVFLDDARTSNQSAVDAFIMLNSGIPCLRVLLGHTSVAPRNQHVSEQPEICNLKHPWMVMKMGIKLLEGTHPDVDRETGPPLLRALCGLMEELGGLRANE